MMNVKKTNESQGEIITNKYLVFLEQHVQEVVQGIEPDFFTLKQIADKIAVSQQHLSETVKKISGNSPCYFYDKKIICEAQRLLLETNMSSAKIANMLTYDPSNFSKFFKKWTGYTPKQYKQIKIK